VAQDCLDAELARRGIADMSPFRKERDEVIEGLEAKRSVRVQFANRTSIWARRFLYTVSAWAFVYSAFLLIGRGSDESFLFMLLSISFCFVTSTSGSFPIPTPTYLVAGDGVYGRYRNTNLRFPSCCTSENEGGTCITSEWELDLQTGTRSVSGTEFCPLAGHI
jgi:hypothetical protein